VKLVIIESPYSGEVRANVAYAFECLKDSIDLGEAPLAFHLLYPHVLNDQIKEERLKGLVCGFQWMAVCDLVAVYTDLGVSPGMKTGITRAKELDKLIEYRSLKE
jgi:hypothetical protein